jgi:hypothetical protein
MELAGAPTEAASSSEHLHEVVRAALGEHLREEKLASIAACSASTPCSLASGEQPMSTPCLASTSTTYCASSWRAPPGCQAREFEMGRRVTGSTMARRGERGDGIGEDKSGHLTGVDICVVRKYMDHVRPHSVRSSGRRRDIRGGAFLKKKN